ncbi:hypothetical protein RRG08_045255 [Elysia crispata]|uniref:Uncharacterized protein n=1 Tax=Elysia crispata TaxID=231223 RepID=A0AAE1A1H0_9GAST|nr:hypothetical protein RRG08_045255 [Elysia crispata]
MREDQILHGGSRPHGRLPNHKHVQHHRRRRSSLSRKHKFPVLLWQSQDHNTCGLRPLVTRSTAHGRPAFFWSRDHAKRMRFITQHCVPVNLTPREARPKPDISTGIRVWFVPFILNNSIPSSSVSDRFISASSQSQGVADTVAREGESVDESACDLSSDLDTTCTGVFIAASITVHHGAQTESHVPLVISMIYLANQAKAERQNPFRLRVWDADRRRSLSLGAPRAALMSRSCSYRDSTVAAEVVYQTMCLTVHLFTTIVYRNTTASSQPILKTSPSVDRAKHADNRKLEV